MNDDISDILDAWPYEPGPHESGRVNVRLIAGNDDRPKIQIRVDLGILQLAIEGRPDGNRPQGYESHLHLQRERLRRHAEEAPNEPFIVRREDCVALREEAVQYYHRYVAFFVLEDFQGVVRDTSRNLEVFDLCARYGESEQDREVLEQFRTYVIMMRTRAQAAEAIRCGHQREAIDAIERGLAEIRQALADRDQSDRFEDANETQILRGLLESLVPKLPASQRMELQERLRAAIDAENYELASILRDELRMLE